VTTSLLKGNTTDRLEVVDGVVANRQDLQTLETVNVGDDVNSVIEQYQVFELHQCRQTLYLLYVVERQIYGPSTITHCKNCRQEVQLSPTNRLSLVHADVPYCVVKSCPLWRMIAIYLPDLTILPLPLPFGALIEGDPLELSGSHLIWEN